ncbi:MAG TPA: thiolase family protein [Candidatus Binataceae bacterium]|nr:thiolase family protein [Candidatus Binataceae bacterium]
MPYNTEVAVIGTAIHAPLTDARRSLEEKLYDVTRAALADASLAINEIDGIVVAANDQLDGRAISVMAASGSVGGVDRDILSTPSASEHAFVMGALRIGSGQYRTQLVVSWSPTEVSSIPEAERLANDPYFHRALPLDELAAGALQAAALEHAVPEARDLALAIVAKNRRHGARAYPTSNTGTADASIIAESKVIRWPLRAAMVSPPMTGAVAIVLASADFIVERKEAPVAWLHGMGWATEASFLGDRDLSRAPALETAVARAFMESGIADPLANIDVIELADATPYQELIAYEALRLCPRDAWGSRIASGAFEFGGALPVNPSGGAIAINPVFCTGLVRIAEAANQVRGRAGPHQVSKTKTALAHAASGFAMQYQTALVLGREPARRQ